MTTATNSKFLLGQIFITPAAQQALNPQDVFLSLTRHAKGDWGDCDEEDWNTNEESVTESLRIFSVYHDREGLKFWIITEASRIMTTILLPEDY